MGRTLGLAVMATAMLGSAELVRALGYLWLLQGGLGSGSNLVIALIGGPLVVLLAGGIGRWGCPGHWTWSQRTGASLGGLCALLAVAFTWGCSMAAVEVHASLPGQREHLALTDWVTSLHLSAVSDDDPFSAHLTREKTAACEASPERRRFTIIAAFVGHTPSGRTQIACAQSDSWGGALSQLSSALQTRAQTGAIKVDVISSTQELSESLSWLDPLKFRPGLDGACVGSRCLMPWQLMSLGLFSPSRFFSHLPPLPLGIDVPVLLGVLGESPRGHMGGVTRVTTRSYVLNPEAKPEGSVVPLLRMRPRRQVLTRSRWKASVGAAQKHLLRSQSKSGSFRYGLEPFSGNADVSTLSLPRHAGALLVLCELGASTEAVHSAIAKGLRYLSRYRRTQDNWQVYTPRPTDERAHLGYAALPLAALVACASRPNSTGVVSEIAALGTFLMKLQRRDGSFAPWLNRTTSSLSSRPPPLYAEGQAVLALVGLETLQRKLRSPLLPKVERIRLAVERAMDYTANEHWDHPLSNYFALEENWHCLAARAALEHHRHSNYERFCLDYAELKSRLVLSESQGTVPAFDGGFGFGNLLPPHNTASAGLGEALAAAAELQLARDDHAGLEETRRTLVRVLAYLENQQWKRESCFACRTGDAEGGLSEYPHTTTLRVDYAQHAWAALGHGGRVLGWK